MSGYPETRLRRFRRTQGLRRMFDMTMPGPEKFIWPVFVSAGCMEPEPIGAMPGQFRHNVDSLLRALEPVAEAGVGGVLVFGLVDEAEKCPDGNAACRGDGVVQATVRAIKQRFPELVVITDVCVCAYTTHGHCGPLTADGDVDNDSANKVLSRMAVSHAAAGADIVAPSAMMDGQVLRIREALDGNGAVNTLIMSYSTKFASSMYGPFREAENSAPGKGDRKGYQASYANPQLALLESELDEDEGADILMVKPALFYLDLISQLRERTDLPIAAYNVSGEYSMLIATADRGWGVLDEMVRESTTALVRAGTNLVISYWANRYADFFQ